MGVFVLIYSLSGLMLIVMGMLTYTQSYPLHVAYILSGIGLLVFIKGLVFIFGR